MAPVTEQVDLTAVEKTEPDSSQLPPDAAPQPPIAQRPRHKWARWAIAMGLAALLAVGALVWRSYSQKAISYETVAVERGPIQATVTATGTVNPVIDVQVGSQVSGNIKALYADYNTTVKKGQLVALIDPAIFQAQVEQAQAAVRSSQAAVITAQAQVEKARSDVAGALAGQKSSEAIMAKDRANELNAEIQWQRAQNLSDAGVISQSDHDTAKATYDSLTAQVAADQAQIDAAKQTVQSAQAQLRVMESQLKSAQAQNHQAQATLDQANINLAHTRIYAPVDGVVIARRVDVGQTVAASLQAPTIFEIGQDLTKMQVDTNVDESDIGGIEVGQSAPFTVDAYPGTTFPGKVVDIRKAPITVQNVVTYDVVISAPNPELKLLPGMTANVTILTARLEDTLKVPNAVLRFRPLAAVLKQAGLPAPQAGKQYLYVLVNGELKAVSVVYGLSDGKSTAVTAGGLRAGDLVLVRATTAASSTTSGAPGSMPRAPRL
jgi:HlyD family secretion protein